MRAAVLLPALALAGCLDAGGDPEVTGGIIHGDYDPRITVLSRQGPMVEEIAIDRFPDGDVLVYDQWFLADCARAETLVVMDGVIPAEDGAGGFSLHPAVAAERARIVAGGRSLAQVQAALTAAGLEAEIDIGGEDSPVVQRNCGPGAG